MPVHHTITGSVITSRPDSKPSACTARNRNGRRSAVRPVSLPSIQSKVVL